MEFYTIERRRNKGSFPHTSQNGHHKQSNKQQVLERLWRKGNPRALLVGLQTGVTTMENSTEFPQKTKNGTAF